jgi:N6-L-threonylcarbamoyladenine synthase
VPTILALETSCDETAVAILRGHELLASEVASQIKEHEKFGGVVPEIASRNHLLHVPRLLDRAIRNGKIDLPVIDAFAATSGPGLASSLMIGASTAKGLAIGFGKPYLAINHLEGHLLSPFFVRATAVSGRSGQEGNATFEIQPNVSLVVSGGHTMSVFVRGVGNYKIIGRTVDDAAGEAFDKVAKLLGLGYPGGPEIEKLARNGDPDRFDLPRSMLDSENFSFSGLKTAVRYLLPKLETKKIIKRQDDVPGGRRVDGITPKGSGRASRESASQSSSSELAGRMPALESELLADLCASFQQAIIDVLVRKTITAAKACDVNLVTVSGGVSCNQELRIQLGDACGREDLDLKTAEPWLCTDNAAMIAFAAMLKLKSGFVSSVAQEIDPNLALG